MGYYLFEFKGKMEEFQKLLKVDADKWYDKKRQRQQKIGQSAGVKDVGENGSGYDSD